VEKYKTHTINKVPPENEEANQQKKYYFFYFAQKIISILSLTPYLFKFLNGLFARKKIVFYHIEARKKQIF
jgi:hypothetical protein